MAFPKSDGTLRPFRLWDNAAKKPLRWRNYASPMRAHNGALIEARWAKVGYVITVYNAKNGRGMGDYKRTVSSIEFTPHGKTNAEEET